MRLFNMDMDTFELDFEPEVFSIKEFNKIVKRDRSKGKTIATAELSYVWFYCDYRSDFLQIIDEDERSIEIINSLSGIPKDWKPDVLVLEAINRYKKLSETVASRMLEDARTMIDGMSKWAKYAATHLDETTSDGRSKFDISKVQAFIKDLPKLQQTINTLEDEILREKDQKDSHRGSQEAALFEDEE